MSAFCFAFAKLRHYTIGNIVIVVSEDDVVKYILTRPIIIERIGK